jgi:hypothetical protein
VLLRLVHATGFRSLPDLLVDKNHLQCISPWLLRLDRIAADYTDSLGPVLQSGQRGTGTEIWRPRRSLRLSCVKSW